MPLALITLHFDFVFQVLVTPPLRPCTVALRLPRWPSEKARRCQNVKIRFESNAGIYILWVSWGIFKWISEWESDLSERMMSQWTLLLLMKGWERPYLLAKEVQCFYNSDFTGVGLSFEHYYSLFPFRWRGSFNWRTSFIWTCTFFPKYEVTNQINTPSKRGLSLIGIVLLCMNSGSCSLIYWRYTL